MALTSLAEQGGEIREQRNQLAVTEFSAAEAAPQREGLCVARRCEVDE